MIIIIIIIITIILVIIIIITIKLICNLISTNIHIHIGDNVDTDVAGAVAAGWNPLRYNEWFDEGFSDWFDYDTKATAAAGQKKRVDMLKWGRRDTEKELEWVELWGLDDVLTMFGFPDDEERYVKTTMIRGMTDDATY